MGKALDSGMQTLVYENYSKFIGATDAVKGVGLGVDSVVGTIDNGGGGGEMFRSIHGIDSVGDDNMNIDPSEEKENDNDADIVNNNKQDDEVKNVTNNVKNTTATTTTSNNSIVPTSTTTTTTTTTTTPPPKKEQEGGLDALVRNITIIEHTSTKMDNDLRSIRLAVADKSRMKLLLLRLESLLILPNTLDGLVKDGQWGLVSFKFMEASRILSKYSGSGSTTTKKKKKKKKGKSKKDNNKNETTTTTKTTTRAKTNNNNNN